MKSGLRVIVYVNCIFTNLIDKTTKAHETASIHFRKSRFCQSPTQINLVIWVRAFRIQTSFLVFMANQHSSATPWALRKINICDLWSLLEVVKFIKPLLQSFWILKWFDAYGKSVEKAYMYLPKSICNLDALGQVPQISFISDLRFDQFCIYTVITSKLVSPICLVCMF